MDAHSTAGEPRALIRRQALLHNAAILRRAVGPRVKLCAIMKADAYGHGAELVADTLCNWGFDGASSPAVDAIAVASIAEADGLPKTGVPVWIFRPVENAFVGSQRQALELAIRNRWVLTLCSMSAAEDVARIAMAMGRRCDVQVMIDTGMTRSGVDFSGAADLLERIESLPALRLAGVGTHFACAEDTCDTLTELQLDRFLQTTAPWNGVRRHAANSAAVFFHPATHLEMARPGISLYGIDPSGRPCMDRSLRPVMKWTAPLLMVRSVSRGGGVGYGHTWRADRDTRIGLVPVGYADGYLRCFSNRSVMLVRGRPAPVVGRVSMDLTTIDLGDVPEAALGDEVTVLDDDPLSPASVYELARLADTIPYEIFCRIGPRVRRVAVEAESTSPSPPTRPSLRNSPRTG